MEDEPNVLGAARAEQNRRLGCFEARQRRRHDVVAGRETRAGVRAVSLGDPLLAHARAGHRHGYTGQRAAARVDDDALDGSCCLGYCRCGGRQQQGDKDKASWRVGSDVHLEQYLRGAAHYGVRHVSKTRMRERLDMEGLHNTC